MFRQSLSRLLGALELSAVFTCAIKEQRRQEMGPANWWNIIIFHPKLVFKDLSHQLICEQKLEFRDLVPELNFALHSSKSLYLENKTKAILYE